MVRTQRETILAFLLVAAGMGAALSPEALQTRLRTLVREAGRPGQRFVQWSADGSIDRARSIARRLAGASQSDGENDASVAELDAFRRRMRRLEIETARLREELDSVRLTGGHRSVGEVGRPLVVVELLEAAVLGRENAELIRAGAILDAGSDTGVSESSLVLDDPRPLLDQGEDAQVAAGQAVLAGRCVAGRIASVGRRVSTLQPLTDPKFRGRAQIVRRTEAGAVYGAEGLLEGWGDPHCRLTLVPATEAVVDGDEVFTGGRDANTPEPMLYGTIVRAVLPEGASHWEIEVKPAVAVESLRRVQVVRKAPNPARMLPH